MAATFQCSIVTPEAPVLDEEVRHASLPAWDGQIGILARRAPLLAKLGSGRLTLDLAGGDTRVYFISGGFAQMKDNRLSILSNEAVLAENIKPDEAEAALREAQALRGTTPAEAERRQRDLDRARAMVSVAERR